jgi:hypothetical protein
VWSWHSLFIPKVASRFFLSHSPTLQLPTLYSSPIRDLIHYNSLNLHPTSSLPRFVIFRCSTKRPISQRFRHHKVPQLELRHTLMHMRDQGARKPRRWRLTRRSLHLRASNHHKTHDTRQIKGPTTSSSQPANSSAATLFLHFAYVGTTLSAYVQMCFASCAS